MGALTKGDRRAEKAGNLDKYNLESKEGRAALNVVLNNIMRGTEVPGLDDARLALSDMGLLRRAEAGEEIADSDKTNIPRFLNRLLSLEVERQNALFEYFYTTFVETIEHLKLKGKLDDGLEDLKAINVKLAEPAQLLHCDILTGARTIYYKLELTVATQAARFSDIAGSGYYRFYEHRNNGTFAAVRPTLSHTDPETGERYQMYSLTRPAGRNLSYIRESELNQKYRIVAGTKAEAWWLSEEDKIPAFEYRTVHLLSGALLPIWKYLKTLQQSGLNIVRTTTDAGVRLVGVNISGEWLGDIRRHFGLRAQIPSSAAGILRLVDFENNIVTLLGDIKIRTTRFQGQVLTEVCPSTFEQIRELRGLGLINITQHGKQRFFIPSDQSLALVCLEKVLALYPPDSCDLRSVMPDMEQEPDILAGENPVQLPEWLIEPAVEEVKRLQVSEGPPRRAMARTL